MSRAEAESGKILLGTIGSTTGDDYGPPPAQQVDPPNQP